ncbi:hypothetical protein FVE85_5927 [Porphyridium purpureum]|uniref:Uncharacterized protein n=1 Tax=Porphyridium purpureum TaxID=35688 RepID=A0A5J4Z5H7_PORPP|nr:hypothetical protein FVE85_5927 [Porphyridium purpureum]|eukprot:POR8775..scf295_1
MQSIARNGASKYARPNSRARPRPSRRPHWRSSNFIMALPLEIGKGRIESEESQETKSFGASPSSRTSDHSKLPLEVKFRCWDCLSSLSTPRRRPKFQSLLAPIPEIDNEELFEEVDGICNTNSQLEDNLSRKKASADLHSK